jgi:hypothetical protein
VVAHNLRTPSANVFPFDPADKELKSMRLTCLPPLFLAWMVAMLLVFEAAAADELIVNGDFEQGPQGWSDFWSRTPGGSATRDTGRKHGGKQSLRVEHTGSQDWSVSQTGRLDVQPEQIYELSGWLWVEGQGDATLSVILYDAQDEALSWSHGGQTVRAADGWQQVQSRFLIPPGTATILPRLIGNRPATVWLDDVQLRRAGSVAEMRSADLPDELTVSNSLLQVALRTRDGTLCVTDRRTGQMWEQRSGSPLIVLDAQAAERNLQVQLLEPAAMLRMTATVELAADQAELVVRLAAKDAFREAIRYPGAFITQAGTQLILPVNEGISYPADDATLPSMVYHTYGGHGLCMGWWGQTDGRRGVLAIVETPDDAGVRLPRQDGLLCLQPEWIPQRGMFGPERRLRYVFLDDGGYVAMCKRYRRYAQEIGLLKTLAEKRREVPAVDLLVGAVNVWCWDRDPAPICRDLQAAGIKRILWSHRSTPEQLQQMNELGVLTSRYDIFQDAMNPANFPHLRGIHADWTSDAWPHDLVLRANGDWERGWVVEGKDGQQYPCGVLCDRQAVAYAQRRIPPELETHPYRSRFIDTTTASSWRECYHPDHPMTRSESRHWKMELLRFVSETCGLVCGSETGHEAAVPYVHYFEGMLSLGPYRVPDSGRRMAEIVEEVPERVAKFQTGHFYRLPLWELVYHDCVVAQWYWGDYNNKLPALWDRRDLFNALYGTPPMFMFRREQWEQQRERFVRSYRTATPVARATGYVEMLSHRWLTDDRTVQQTEFANGIIVTVNFGDQPYRLGDGTELQPLGHHWVGLGENLP